MPPPRPRGLIALPEGPSQRLGLGRDRREAQNPERGRRPCPRGAEAGRGRRRNEGVSRRPREGPLRRAKEIPRRGVGRGYAPRRGGERAGSAGGDAITNPSRSSKPRRRAPPGWPPPDPPPAAAAGAGTDVDGEDPAQHARTAASLRPQPREEQARRPRTHPANWWPAPPTCLAAVGSTGSRCRPPLHPGHPERARRAETCRRGRERGRK